MNNAEQLAEYVLPQNKELNMVFQFELAYLDSPKCSALEVAVMAHRPWRLSELKAIVTKWQTLERDAGFWNASVQSSLSRHRSA